MNNREKFDETSILPKEAFYSKLNEEGISDADYARIKKTWKVFEIRNLSWFSWFVFITKFHYLYVQCDKLLLADVSENFRDKCIKIYELDTAPLVVRSRISIASLLKIYESKFRIINRY